MGLNHRQVHQFVQHWCRELRMITLINWEVGPGRCSWTAILTPFQQQRSCDICGSGWDKWRVTWWWVRWIITCLQILPDPLAVSRSWGAHPNGIASTVTQPIEKGYPEFRRNLPESLPKLFFWSLSLAFEFLPVFESLGSRSIHYGLIWWKLTSRSRPSWHLKKIRRSDIFPSLQGLGRWFENLGKW